MLKATVSCYLAGGSNCVYGCLVDASKAFDTVDHTLLLEKLRPTFMCCLFSAHIVSDATIEGELE